MCNLRGWGSFVDLFVTMTLDLKITLNLHLNLTTGPVGFLKRGENGKKQKH